jgi:hypothetical protein
MSLRNFPHARGKCGFIHIPNVDFSTFASGDLRNFLLQRKRLGRGDADGLNARLMFQDITYLFDRDILHDDRAYWRTFSTEEIVPRVALARTGCEIYLLMSCGKNFSHREVYRHFGLSAQEVDEAEKSGWTDGCFALGAALGKPRGTRPQPRHTTQAEIDADPAWPGVQENRLRSFLTHGHSFTPESLKEISEIFSPERLDKVIAKIPFTAAIPGERFLGMLLHPDVIQAPAKRVPSLARLPSPIPVQPSLQQGASL